MTERRRAAARRSGAVDPDNGGGNETTDKIPLRIARAIARHVAAERLPPGTLLEPEHEMARRFGVGRTSVREALRLLEAQGLIEIRRGVKGGPVVASPSASDLGHTIAMFLQVRSTPLRTVIDAGAELAGLMARRAAEEAANRGTSVERLQQVLEREGAMLESEEERLRAGISFHHELHTVAGNDVLTLLIEAVGGIVADRTRAYRHDHWDVDERRSMYGEHVELYEAIKRGDGETASLIAREHMLDQAEHDLQVHPQLANAIVDWR